MEERKKIILSSLILTVLVLSVVCGIVFFRSAKNQPSPSQPSNQNVGGLPSKGYYTPSSSDKDIHLQTSGGEVIINNIYKNAINTYSDGGVSFKDNNDYYIAYYPQDQGFIVTIENPDIQTARQKAEADFVQTLGITQAQACQLRVSLGVPVSVNEQASGGNYGLSFCPNGKPFPNE